MKITASRTRQESTLKLVFRAGVPMVMLAVGAGSLSAAEPEFKAQTIDDKIGIGYGLTIGDVDGDGKADILLADAKEIVWYRNPMWDKRRITGSLTQRDHVCIAARDVDGDGRVEIAVGAQWNPGETVNPAESGAVFYLQRPEQEGGDWKPVQLPHDPTVHRMHWVKNGDGKACLVVLPLHGRENRNGAGEHGVRITTFLFPEQPADPDSWKPRILDETLHMTHNFDLLPVGEGETMAVAAREGFLLARPAGAGWETDRPALTDLPSQSVPFAGIGEIRFGPERPGGSRADVLTAVEPFHGPTLALFEKDPATREWKRQVLDSSMNQGHALACGNLLGLPRGQIVAGWREPNDEGAFGIRLFRQESADGPWQASWVADGNTMACEDLKLADLDGDGRLDIIAAGRSTKNVVIYWNRAGIPAR